MTDPLMKRFLELSLMQNIPDMAVYADEWNKLAADARAVKRPHLADTCTSRWQAYKGLSGEYVRLVEGSFSELLEA